MKSTYPQVIFNEADVGVPCFIMDTGQSDIVDFSNPTYRSPYLWISRAPRPLSKATNLLRIYNPDCWALIFSCIVIVSVFLVVAAKLGSWYNVDTRLFAPDDVVLVPFR